MAKTGLRGTNVCDQGDEIQAHLSVVFFDVATSRHLHAATSYAIRRIIRAPQSLRDISHYAHGPS